jgi:hypothetical protein
MKKDDIQISAMIGISRYYCNDVASRPDPPTYIGTEHFVSAPSRSGQFHPPNRVFISDWTVPAAPSGAALRGDICCVEVDSDYVDPGFKIDIWRSVNTSDIFMHVCRIDMPLVKGLNRKVVPQETRCQPGDVIGWWSSTRSEVKYATMSSSGHALPGCRVRYADDFTTTNFTNSSQDVMSFDWNGAFTDRVFSIRIMWDSDTWLDMQQAVLDNYSSGPPEHPEIAPKAPIYLDLARRTHFEDKSLVPTDLMWDKMERICTQHAIFQFPFPPPPPTETARMNYTYQEMIRHFCVLDDGDKVKVGDEYSRVIGDTIEWYQPYHTYHGMIVRHWLEANKDMILKSGVIGDFANFAYSAEPSFSPA